VVHLDGLHHSRYLAIGSILGSANRHAEVWGSGFICEDASISGRPRAVHAVRGQLSRLRLLALGIECPEVYGDPALLLPMFFNPPVEKRFAVGLIPHYADKVHPWVERQRRDPEVRIIDVEGGIHRFVEEVKSCELIISSSLHGIICADAYGVQALWMELSDQVLGGGFKFYDYFSSIQREVVGPVVPGNNKSLAQIAAQYRPYRVRLDLLRLLRACPFLSDNLRRKVLNSTQVPCGLSNFIPPALC
jgi:pyruvyltransferase